MQLSSSDAAEWMTRMHRCLCVKMCLLIFIDFCVRICAYKACAPRYCVGTGFVLVFGGGCDGLKWSQLLLLLLHHRYQHIVLWLWLSLVDVYSASFCCCYWQLFWSVKKLCVCCCSCGGGGEPAAAAALVVIVVDAAIVLYRSVSVFM